MNTPLLKLVRGHFKKSPLIIFIALSTLLVVGVNNTIIHGSEQNLFVQHTNLNITESTKQDIEQEYEKKLGDLNYQPIRSRKKNECEDFVKIIENNTEKQSQQQKLSFLIQCESNCNSNANNNNKYFGILQFSKPTFKQYGDGNIWEVENQIQAALEILQNGGFKHHWPACANKYYNDI